MSQGKSDSDSKTYSTESEDAGGKKIRSRKKKACKKIKRKDRKLQRRTRKMK